MLLRHDWNKIFKFRFHWFLLRKYNTIINRSYIFALKKISYSYNFDLDLIVSHEVVRQYYIKLLDNKHKAFIREKKHKWTMYLDNIRKIEEYTFYNRLK